MSDIMKEILLSLLKICLKGEIGRQNVRVGVKYKEDSRRTLWRSWDLRLPLYHEDFETDKDICR